MVRLHNSEAPRDPRGASSWARRLNDSTPEWLAAVARLTAVGAFFALIGLLAVAVLLASAAVFLVALLVLAVMVLAGWLGFILLANPEWKDDDDAETAE